MYKTITTEVEVEVSLSDFDTDDLIEELEHRGTLSTVAAKNIVYEIWMNRRIGKPYEDLLDKLIYDVLGKTL
tara:strand:- start:214 stop:429 length:216 start_codon:yes stop_codon:yes gene_type:complete